MVAQDEFCFSDAVITIAVITMRCGHHLFVWIAIMVLRTYKFVCHGGSKR